jgi:hypothetical protein
MLFAFRKITDEEMASCKGQVGERPKTAKGNDNWTACTKKIAICTLISWSFCCVLLVIENKVF